MTHPSFRPLQLSLALGCALVLPSCSTSPKPFNPNRFGGSLATVDLNANSLRNNERVTIELSASNDSGESELIAVEKIIGGTVGSRTITVPAGRAVTFKAESTRATVKRLYRCEAQLSSAFRSRTTSTVAFSAPSVGRCSLELADGATIATPDNSPAPSPTANNSSPPNPLPNQRQPSPTIGEGDALIGTLPRVDRATIPVTKRRNKRPVSISEHSSTRVQQAPSVEESVSVPASSTPQALPVRPEPPVLQETGPIDPPILERTVPSSPNTRPKRARPVFF